MYCTSYVLFDILLGFGGRPSSHMHEYKEVQGVELDSKHFPFFSSMPY